jgi:hypothetical protein
MVRKKGERNKERKKESSTKKEREKQRKSKERTVKEINKERRSMLTRWVTNLLNEIQTKAPLLLTQMGIERLQQLRNITQEERNILFRTNKKDTWWYGILGKRLDKIDGELEKRTGRSRQVLSQQRCGLREEQESEQREKEAKLIPRSYKPKQVKVRTITMENGETITHLLE